MISPPFSDKRIAQSLRLLGYTLPVFKRNYVFLREDGRRGVAINQRETFGFTTTNHEGFDYSWLAAGSSDYLITADGVTPNFELVFGTPWDAVDTMLEVSLASGRGPATVSALRLRGGAQRGTHQVSCAILGKGGVVTAVPGNLQVKNEIRSIYTGSCWAVEITDDNGWPIVNLKNSMLPTAPVKYSGRGLAPMAYWGLYQIQMEHREADVCLRIRQALPANGVDPVEWHRVEGIPDLSLSPSEAPNSGFAGFYTTLMENEITSFSRFYTYAELSTAG